MIADLPGPYSAFYRVDGKTGEIEAPSVAVPDTYDGGGIQVGAVLTGRVVVGAGAVWISRLANPSDRKKRLARVVRVPLRSAT